MSEQLEIRAFIDEYGHRVRLYALEANHYIGGPRKAYPGPSMEPIEFEQGLSPPVFAYMAPESAQSLANDLWAAGFRPTQGKQSEGQITATQSHLADMRAIAFAKLNVEKP